MRHCLPPYTTFLYYFIGSLRPSSVLLWERFGAVLLAYQKRITANYTGASKSNLISHVLIRLVRKLKIENFHVFDIHWLYRKSRYAIVKADVT